MENIPEKFQLQVLHLKERTDLTETFNFTPLVNNAKYIYSLFDSTYRCEWLFS